MNIQNTLSSLRAINSSVCRLVTLAEAYVDGKHRTGGKEFSMSVADKQAVLDEYHALDAALTAAIADYNANKP